MSRNIQYGKHVMVEFEKDENGGTQVKFSWIATAFLVVIGGLVSFIFSSLQQDKQNYFTIHEHQEFSQRVDSELRRLEAHMKEVDDAHENRMTNEIRRIDNHLKDIDDSIIELSRDKVDRYESGRGKKQDGGR